MSGTNHPVTRHHIPQERRPELHHYKSLKPHTSMCDLCEARLWTLLNDFIMQPIMLHRLECVEILSEHVSTCTGCDLNTTSVVSKLWQKYEECVHISQQKMSNQNLEQWININFCVKVRETCNVSEEYVWDRNYEEIRCFWVTQFTGGWEKMEDTDTLLMKKQFYNWDRLFWLSGVCQGRSNSWASQIIQHSKTKWQHSDTWN